MKICYVHEEYPEETNFGGIATYQKNTAEQMVKEGNAVYVICRSLTHDCSYIENGVNIIKIYVNKNQDDVSRSIKYRKKIAKILNKLQNNNLIDIIETPDWGAETIFFEKKRKIPLIVRLHTPLKIWLKYNQNNFGRIKNKMLRWESKMILSADLITCCSNALKEMVIKDFNINDDDIIVTPNPANIIDFYKNNQIPKENKLIYVGSLEERKGVLVLANALNIIFGKYPALQIDFIGKDTLRNKDNISTKVKILKIVDKKYHSQINFIGQIENNKLNNYLNKSLVAVFPSLFDNFPYVVLESMACGLHIVGSKNSGMVEMLNDDLSIYKTGDVVDLSNKIIQKYKKALSKNINEKNISRVTKIYNSHYVCVELTKIYELVIKNFNNYSHTKHNFKEILINVTKDEIKKITIINKGTANLVFKITTITNNNYIVKKYLYNYNFDLAKMLYDIYEKSQITIIKPLNDKLINYKGYDYNIFAYKKKNMIFKAHFESFLLKILSCDRKVDIENTILTKFEKYYDYLDQREDYNKKLSEEIKYVVRISEKIKDIPHLKDTYINHGDISKNNIIYSKKELFIIDFDEATISSPLYDFAVIIIKMCTLRGKINTKKYNYYKYNMKQIYPQYNDNDYKSSIKFYLCKILLEKFYLHEEGKIDLFEKDQSKDSYKYYLNLLKSIV